MVIRGMIYYCYTHITFHCPCKSVRHRSLLGIWNQAFEWMDFVCPMWMLDPVTLEKSMERHTPLYLLHLWCLFLVLVYVGYIWYMWCLWCLCDSLESLFNTSSQDPARWWNKRYVHLANLWSFFCISNFVNSVEDRIVMWTAKNYTMIIPYGFI